MKSVNMVLHNFLERAFSFLVKCWYIVLELSNIQIAFRSLYKREVWMKFLSYRITILSDLCIDTSIIGRWMNLAKIHQTPKTPLKYEGMSLVLVFFTIKLWWPMNDRYFCWQSTINVQSFFKAHFPYKARFVIYIKMLNLANIKFRI